MYIWILFINKCLLYNNTNTLNLTNNEISYQLEEILIDINSKLEIYDKMNILYEIINAEYTVDNKYGIIKYENLKENIYKFNWEGHEIIKFNQFVVPSNLVFKLFLNDVQKILKKMLNQSVIIEYLKWRLPNKPSSLRDKILLRNFYKSKIRDIQKSILCFTEIYDEFCEFRIPDQKHIHLFDVLASIFYDSLNFNYKLRKQIKLYKRFFGFESDVEILILENDTTKNFVVSEFQGIFMKLFLDNSIINSR